MKRWLITTAQGNDLSRLRRDVAAHGGTLSDAPPVPLDGDHHVVEAQGPDDLNEKLREHPAVHKVSPDSEIGLHDTDGKRR